MIRKGEEVWGDTEEKGEEEKWNRKNMNPI